MIKFRNNGFIEEKVYSLNYAVNDSNKRPIILITYNKKNFLANNNQYQAWLNKSHVFLYSKKRKKDIIVLDFLLS